MQSLWDPRGATRLYRMVKELDASIVHTRTVRADVVGRIGASCGAIVINNIVNLYPDDSLTWHGPVKGRAVLSIARATRSPVSMFVANARALTPSIGTVFGVPEERIRVIHDGIRLEPWQGAMRADLGPQGIHDDRPVCFTAARLHPQKGLEDLIDAAAKVGARRPDVRFVIAGDGPLRGPLQRQIDGLGLQDTIHLLGWREDIPELLARSDLFVLPSRFEGLPNAVIEAMAAGVPSVATAVAGTPELIEHGETGWLTPPGHADALADTILGALAADLKVVSDAARRRAERHFSVQQMAKSFAGLYAELLDKRMQRATATAESA